MQFRLQEYAGSRFVTADVLLSGESLTLTYDLSGIDGINWPAPIPIPSRENGLWRHTCVELFLATPGNNRYVEFNLSPSGAWNCYQFDDYREGMQQTDTIKLTQMEADQSTGRIVATTSFKSSDDQLLIGPAVVIEDLDGKIFYFAVEHSRQPDFHRHDFYIHTTRNHL